MSTWIKLDEYDSAIYHIYCSQGNQKWFVCSLHADLLEAFGKEFAKQVERLFVEGFGSIRIKLEGTIEE
jgi:hypothetical protein